ncbi:MAG TPA: HD domain-containing protein [Verrucomicrobiae bacterium]
MNLDQAIDEIFASFRLKGHRSYGENITETEHALQCATFAQRVGEPAEMVAACLIHDYGHLCHDLGEEIADHGIDSAHEELGAKFLERWFPPEITEPVRLHVAAKRYLCWIDKAYFEKLSDASRQSLQLQGGPMTDDEAHAFEQHPHFHSAIQLRRYDDMGKEVGMKTPDFEVFREVLRSVAARTENVRP